MLACTIWMGAPVAHAQTDVIREWNTTYDIKPDGTVDVTWEIDWDFGETGRRGILMGIVEREPWEDDPTKDAVYDISDIDVSSPTGAPATFTTDTVHDGPFRLTEVRIGDPDKTLDESRHTYIINYEMTGALRTFDGEPEFFWDLNSGSDTPIDVANLTVTAPEGVTEARCLLAKDECEATIADGVATYRATDVTNKILSVVAAMPPGSVENAEPTLREAQPGDGSPISLDGMEIDWTLAGIIAALAAAFRGLSGWFRRPKAKDERWTGVAPGVMNPGGPITTDPAPGTVPVRFTPPEASLLEAGRALDKGSRASHLSANLVQMAVEGSIDLVSEPLNIVQRDPRGIQDGMQQRLFQLAVPADAYRQISGNELMTMTEVVRNSVPGGDHAITKTTKAQGQRLPFKLVSILLKLIPLVVILGLATRQETGLDSWLENQNIDVFPWLIKAAVVYGAIVLGFWLGSTVIRRVERPGYKPVTRTARGTAIKEQAEGFRQYIATAEAGQLNFEADRDIYRRYLPWAVLFNLTDRWVEVGRDLVHMGQMSEAQFMHVAGSTRVDELDRTLNNVHQRERSAQAERRREAQARRESASRSYGSGSGGSSGRSSSSSGGGGGGGSRSSSW